MPETLLIIEDEKLFAAELARHYRKARWEVVVAETLTEARRLLLDDGLTPLIVLSDMSLPDGDALDLLEEVQAQGVSGEWLFLTGYGTVGDSVRALKLGAYDFLQKPCDIDRLDVVVGGLAKSARAQRRLREIAEDENRRYRLDAFVGRSRAAEAVRTLLRRLSRVPISSLVIEGETGTGKGLAARILHHNGPRAHGPLIELNCAALPKELMESELFGHEKGAFTGAQTRRRGLIQQSSGGTLFLDEISEMPLDLQSKLLKVVEDRRVRPLGSEQEVEVDLQLIAATNRDLARLTDEKRFRADLYHRLSVFSLRLPTLRERLEDLDDLVPLFVAEQAARAGKRVETIPNDAWSALTSYDWPGNVRELRNVIERCVLLSEGPVLSSRWLELGARETPPNTEPPGQTSGGEESVVFKLDGTRSIDDMEREILERALERTGHNVTAAARLLGTTRQTLRYRVDKYGLRSSDNHAEDAGDD
jgi:DNA-binding NtrC family response regulator